MFRIDLTPLEPGVHHLTREVPPGALEKAPAEADRDDAADETDPNGTSPEPVTEDVTFGPVEVDAVLDYQPDRALVTFQARTTATLTCDRTLQRFEQPLEGSYAVLFAPPGRGTPEQSEEHDELRPLGRGTRYLDLTGAVRDTLLLAVPQRKVAPGAEDEEIETTFGNVPADEAPVDPRWEKLRELRAGGNGS